MLNFSFFQNPWTKSGGGGRRGRHFCKLVKNVLVLKSYKMFLLCTGSIMVLPLLTLLPPLELVSDFSYGKWLEFESNVIYRGNKENQRKISDFQKNFTRGKAIWVRGEHSISGPFVTNFFFVFKCFFFYCFWVLYQRFCFCLVW